MILNKKEKIDFLKEEIANAYGGIADYFDELETQKKSLKINAMCLTSKKIQVMELFRLQLFEKLVAAQDLVMQNLTEKLNRITEEANKCS